MEYLNWIYFILGIKVGLKINFILTRKIFRLIIAKISKNKELFFFLETTKYI